MLAHNVKQMVEKKRKVLILRRHFLHSWSLLPSANVSKLPLYKNRLKHTRCVSILTQHFFNEKYYRLPTITGTCYVNRDCILLVFIRRYFMVDTFSFVIKQPLFN